MEGLVIKGNRKIMNLCMKENKKFTDSELKRHIVMRKLTRYLITIAISLIVAGLVCGYELQYYDVKRHLGMIISNSAFVSGVVMIVAGLLCVVSNGGGMDAFAYVLYMVKNKFRNVTPDNYTEFVKDRRENKIVAVDNMFAVGAVMVMVAVVAAIL